MAYLIIPGQNLGFYPPGYRSFVASIRFWDLGFRLGFRVWGFQGIDLTIANSIVDLHPRPYDPKPYTPKSQTYTEARLPSSGV